MFSPQNFTKISPQKNITIISGSAKIIDGDSLRVSGKEIRIINIDAPEFFQTCKDKNNKVWQCGKAATKRLKQLVANKIISCQVKGIDKYDRFLAVCYVDDNDIGAILVSEGLALEYGDYKSEQEGAKRKGVGMWQGEFITPKEWRRLN